jgi:solute carrier family 35 (UDP-sugar transporter), member A1/2/3
MIVKKAIFFLLLTFLSDVSAYLVNNNLKCGTAIPLSFGPVLGNKKISVAHRSDICTLKALKINSVDGDKHVRAKAAFALTALVIQNSALALLMRLSRVTTKSSSGMYIVSTAVVLSEFIKVLISLIGLYYEDASKKVDNMVEKIKNSSKPRDLVKIVVPAALYVLQNNLQYVAMSNLPAEVYQVLIQGKIITTAIFSVLILNRRYSLTQWSSVFALSLGVALVQFSLKTAAITANHVNFAIGISSVLISTLTSGFASVYLEKMLKSKGSFWIRNVQLSFVSLAIAAAGSFVKDSQTIMNRGFFAGYNPLVLSVILTQALGGMLVAFVVRYTNSIVKGFAASGSIVLSCIVSAIFLSDYKLNRLFTVGTAMVCASALAWALSPTPATGKKNVLIERKLSQTSFVAKVPSGPLESNLEELSNREDTPEELVGASSDSRNGGTNAIDESL